MSDLPQPGPSRARLSHVPLVPASHIPSSPISAQYRFDAPHPTPSKKARAASLTKSFLGLGLRRGSRKPTLEAAEEIAPGPSRPPGPPPSITPESPKVDKRKAYIHHSPRTPLPLSPPLAQATSPNAARPRVSLPHTDRWCLSYDVAGLDPVPLDDADHVVFSSTYRPLKQPAPADPRHLAAPLPASHWSDCSSAESEGEEEENYEEEDLPRANSRREAGIYKAELIPVVPRDTGSRTVDESEDEVSSQSSAASSRSSSPRSDRSHVRKDSITTQATSAFSSPQVVHTEGAIFEMCESPSMEHVFGRAQT